MVDPNHFIITLIILHVDWPSILIMTGMACLKLEQGQTCSVKMVMVGVGVIFVGFGLRLGFFPRRCIICLGGFYYKGLSPTTCDAWTWVRPRIYVHLLALTVGEYVTVANVLYSCG